MAFRSAKGVSVVDQRLAAETHKRQIEAIVKAEGIARRLDARTDEVADTWLQILTSDQDIALKIRSGTLVWSRHFDRLTDEAADQFRAFAVWSHLEMVHAMAVAIPRQWFKTVPAIAILNLEGETDAPKKRPLKSSRVLVPGQLNAPDLRANVFTEPIAERKRRMTDEQWERVLSEVVFKPPDPVEVERMLHTPDPITGRSWQARFEDLSRKITDVDRLSQELIVGFSGGENLHQLKKRALPLVQGIQSSAKRIVRTEGLRVAEQVQRRAWSGLGDMMVGAQVLAVLDQNTRPHHAERNGTIYYQQPEPGQKSMAELPMLPDEPNCRCWSTPVLKPPDELATDPDVAAAFANASGAGIPDPASYDQWFAKVDRDRRIMAVGSRRYRAVEDMLQGFRPPEWTDFIDTDGKLLPIAMIKSESAVDRAIRKHSVGEIIRQRRQQVEALARRGFVIPGEVQPIVPPPAVVVPPIPVTPTAPFVSPLPAPDLPPTLLPTASPDVLAVPSQPLPAGQKENDPDKSPRFDGELENKYQSAMTAIAEPEARIRLQKHETLVIASEKGTILGEIDGNQNSVNVQGVWHLLEGSVVTHNHPSGANHAKGTTARRGTSFSRQDIEVGVSAGIKAMRALTPTTNHMLEFSVPVGVSRDEYLHRTVLPAWKRLDAKVRRKWTKKINAAADSGDIAAWKEIVAISNVEHNQEVVELLASELGWKYERTDNDDE